MPKKQSSQTPRRIPTIRTVQFEAQTINQEKFVKNIERNVVSFGIGIPGSGKTYLALATALKALVEQKCERVVITRPMVEAGPSIGFQPGNEEEKLGVYLKHIYDMIYKLLPKVLADDLLDSGKISIGAITFMRGMNFENSYVIIDEAENLDKKSFYLLLTRICEGSKMIFCGDTGQVDLKNPSESGLNDAVLKFQGKENFSVTEFTIEDCRRSKVVMEVIKAYFPNSTKTK